MAHWLWKNLHPLVDKMVVCDPRRNALICQDGDSDDPIDAAKLAQWLGGGYLRVVHHGDHERQVLLKRWVALYHDRVREGVRQVNKRRGCGRACGRRIPGRVLRDWLSRGEWLEGLGLPELAEQLQMLLKGLDVVLEQVAHCRGQRGRRAGKYAVVGYWQELPGVGLVRAATLYAYLDTPWRFDLNPHKLWKYCGVGLERSTSGTDRHGRPKPGRLHLAGQVNRRLKNVARGMTLSALRQRDNVFARMHQQLLRKGVSLGNARHTLARKRLRVMWGRWKCMSRFDESLVGGG
jgi:hypothetical protein